MKRAKYFENANAFADEDEDDIITYCDINVCSDCPRYGDDCDGKWEDEGDGI